MTENDGKHAFVSYVHEDDAEVDQLCAVLEAANIPYWRDRTSLGPGDAWKAKIRDAIRNDSLVFLACFSDNSRAKDKSHMNEELTIAVEEYRKMPPGRIWLIPVRFDSGDVPDWELRAGQTLSDLNYSDLFGQGYAAQAASLVTRIHGLMGDKQLGAAAALEAVEQATAADRAPLLRRLTKEMVMDPRRRIELDDLISQETRRVVSAISDPDRLSLPLTGTDDDQVLQLAAQAEEFLEVTMPFCASLQVAARWGSPDDLTPWANGIRSFVQTASRPKGGIQGRLALRYLPGVLAIMTAALASGASRRWANAKVLVAESVVRDRYEPRPLALLEAADPYKPFENQGWTAHVLARAAQTGESLPEALEAFRQRRATRFYTPLAEWLYAALRAVFEDQLPDDDIYGDEFDRAEVLLGVLAQDAVNVRIAASPDGRGWGRSHWFGRSTWRAVHDHGRPVEELREGLDSDGGLWGPLQGGLFGGSVDRARTAIDAYAVRFTKIAGERY